MFTKLLILFAERGTPDSAIKSLSSTERVEKERFGECPIQFQSVVPTNHHRTCCDYIDITLQPTLDRPCLLTRLPCQF